MLSQDMHERKVRREFLEKSAFRIDNQGCLLMILPVTNNVVRVLRYEKTGKPENGIGIY